MGTVYPAWERRILTIVDVFTQVDALPRIEFSKFTILISD
jgi:hypothetical protein